MTGGRRNAARNSGEVGGLVFGGRASSPEVAGKEAMWAKTLSPSIVVVMIPCLAHPSSLEDRS